MKYMSIRMKVTLWYALSMLLLIGVSMIFISELSKRAMLVDQQGHLTETVVDAAREIKDFEQFEYYDAGIDLLAYEADGTLIAGTIPKHFDYSLRFKNDSIQSVKAGPAEYFVYDHRFTDDSGTEYWMRGAVRQAAPDYWGGFIVRFVSGFLPVFVLVSCILGYFITGRAFRPIKKIQQTAQNITDSNQLSLRIGLPDGRDEVARLGKTVDGMLDKLENSFEQEKQFTSDVSHELRTPLAVILTESEYALMHGESMDDMKESMEVVNRQASRMSDLIHQLLFFSRSDNGSLELKKEQFAVFPVISELAEDFRIVTPDRDISFSAMNDGARNILVTADKTLFIRCLSNILQNAIQYGKAGGRIEIGLASDADWLTVSVRDDGVGIDPDNLDKIWNRFYQVEESRNKSKGGSMGLGLSMVKTIIEKHGGRITACSVRGQGSTFKMFFPLH